MNLNTFTPDGNNNTVNIAASTASQRVAFPANIEVKDVQVYNDSATKAFVEFGDVSIAAALTTSIPVGPNACVVFGADRAKYAAVILPSGTGNVYFTPGRGI